MDWLINDALPVLARVFIVWIFPLSSLDKFINWDNALKQANSSRLPGGPVLLILAMGVELLTPPMIIFGFYDGIAAFFLAGYFAVTAIVYHNFWIYLRFWSPRARISARMGLLQEFRLGRRPDLRHVCKRLPAGPRRPYRASISLINDTTKLAG